MRTSRLQPIDWLLPRVRKCVLTLLCGGERRAWHLREVVRRTGCAVGTVRRELKGLAACGIVIERRDGNRTSYEANPECPFYAELAMLIKKTSGLADVLKGALAEFAPRINAAFVYGSHARGTTNARSDVDLMVIGEVGFGEVVSALAEAQELIGREINPSVYSPEEFREKAQSGHHFIQAVLADKKIFLLGDENGLRELGG